MGMSVSCLDIVDAFVCNPSDGLDVGRCKEATKLFIDKGSRVTIISLDLLTQLLANRWHFFHGQALPKPYGVGMPVNAHVIESGVSNAVVKLDELFAVEYLNMLDVAGQYVYSFGFHLTIGADSYVEHVGTCTASSPAFNDRLSVYDVTLPAIIWRQGSYNTCYGLS